MAFTLSIDDVPEHNVGMELARILRRVGDELRELPDGRAGSGTVTDLKGRTIGNWTFIPE